MKTILGLMFGVVKGLSTSASKEQAIAIFKMKI